MNTLKTLLRKTFAFLTESDVESRTAGDRVIREITIIR